jgi:putative DNA methylase
LRGIFERRSTVRRYRADLPDWTSIDAITTIFAVATEGLEERRERRKDMPTVLKAKKKTTRGSARVHRQSLVEAGQIPIDLLVAFAVREGRRPRPIYTAHKWFARRLGSVFRSLLIGVTSEPNADFRRLYYGDADLTGLQVLDPFVGGGTSVFEASRLGATAFGCDVDPVACAVSRMELGAANLPDLAPTLAKLKERVGSRLAQYHARGSDVVLHHFWVQRVSCAGCDNGYDAHPNHVLADDGSSRHAFCANCGAVQQIAAGASSFRCDCCTHDTICDHGNVVRGRAECPTCGHAEKLIDYGRRTGAPEWRLFAVETISLGEGSKVIPMSQRTFRAADERDRRSYDNAVSALAEAEAAGDVLIPDDPVDTAGWSDERLSAYGYRRWRDLFNARQLLHLGLLAKEISLLAPPLRGAVAMAFSDHLTTNCMMASYASGWRRLTPLFSLRAFRHIQRPVELNPWIERAGRGTFPNAIRKLTAAAAYARSPKEPTGTNGFLDVPTRADHRRNQIHMGTAGNLAFLASDSIDVVMTDPPYFDNIAYSELARFFGPWLKNLDVLDEREQQDILANSLVANRSRAGSVERYTEGLGQAFVEIARVLKPNGIVAFSYRHTDAPAWQALAEAIARTDLRITKVLPMPGEAGNGLHAQGDRGLWDAVFVLRHGPGSTPVLRVSEREITEVEAEVADWVVQYGNLQLPFNQIDAAALRRAALVGKALASKRKQGRPKWVALEDALR